MVLGLAPLCRLRRHQPLLPDPVSLASGHFAMPFDSLARAKCRRAAKLAAVAASARDENVARRIVEDAAAARVSDVLTAAWADPARDASSDEDVGRASVAASARVRARSQAAPSYRLASIRERTAATQQHALCRGEP